MASLCLGQFQKAIPQYLLEEQFFHSSLGLDPDWFFPEVTKISSFSWNSPDTFQQKESSNAAPPNKSTIVRRPIKILLADAK